MTADIFRGLQLSHFYILHFLLLQSQPALTGALARTLIFPRHWPVLGERPHPISGTTRQYQRPVGERRWDWMASSGEEGGRWGKTEWEVESHQLPFKDESPQSRLLHKIQGSRFRQWEQVFRITEKLNGEIIEFHQQWKAMTVSKHDDGMGLLRWKEEAREASVASEREARRQWHGRSGWQLKNITRGGWPACWHHLPASPPAAMPAVGW